MVGGHLTERLVQPAASRTLKHQNSNSGFKLQVAAYVSVDFSIPFPTSQHLCVFDREIDLLQFAEIDRLVKSKAEFSATGFKLRELVSNLARQNSLLRRIQVSRCKLRLQARRFLDADFSFHVSDFEFSLQSGSRGAFHFSILVSRFKLREEDDQEMTRSALSISQFSFLDSKARSLIANPPGLRFSFRVSRFHFGALSRTLERAHFSILLSGFYFQGRAGK